jgi:transposase
MNKNQLTETSLDVAAPAAPQRKRYAAAFKQAAVENWIKSRLPGTQIAAELGISYPSLKEWKRHYGGAAMPEHGDLAAENRTLRAELARVREQRDILKKTLGVFTEPLPSATKPLKA